MIKVGLIGYGKAGRAVAQVLQMDPQFDLRWVAKRSPSSEMQTLDGRVLPVVELSAARFPQ